MQNQLHRATVSDIKGIHAILLKGAEEGQLLPRSLSDLYNRTRDFYVLKDGGEQIVGCCALAIVWEDLAEIRSLYVDTSIRRLGLGRLLAQACFDDAVRFGLRRIFTLTYQSDFFAALGFQEVDKDCLPQKIWADCIHCPKYPNCDETAMQRTL
ncbi:MAG: N-acetyltransferase [Desulfovibrio sp.]|jgi:amino-acid N-acetyltransferase|nr:N-acetyltransferase [Desulfovibrio sp.]